MRKSATTTKSKHGSKDTEMIKRGAEKPLRKGERKMCECAKCKRKVEKLYNFDSDNMDLCWVCYKTMQLKEEGDEFWTTED